MMNVTDQVPDHFRQETPFSTDQTHLALNEGRIARQQRQRATRACDGCRRTKEKCVGVPCQRCLHHKRRCEFKSVPVVRTTSSRPYSLSDRSVKTIIDRAEHMERIIQHHLPWMSLDDDSLRERAHKIASAEAPASHDISEDAGSESGRDLAIEDENCTLNAVNDTVTHYSGEFSYWNFSMRLTQRVKDLMGAEEQRPVSQYWRVDQLRSSSKVMSEALSNLPPLHIAEFLVQAFFQHAASNYFYVERQWLLERLAFVYTGAPRLTPKDAGTLAVLLGVFAVGTQYVHLQSVRNKDPRSTPPSTREEELGSLFYQQAARLLPEVIHLGSLESAQACLLLGFYSLPIDASGLGYIYLNLAIKLAMQNGLHRRTSDGVFNPTIIDVRNKVWWTIYCTEKRISVYHGRPVSVRPSDIDADLPHHEPEASASSSEVSNLLISIKLTEFLGIIWEETILLHKRQKPEICGVLGRLIAKRDELKHWWETLSFKTRDSSRSNIHLQLECCLVRMFIGRPFLSSLDTSGVTPDTSTEDWTGHRTSRSPHGGVRPEESSRKSRVSALLDDCVQAAMEAVDLCQILRDTGPGLAKASYVEYSSCRASLLVLIAYSIRSQTVQCYNHLQKGLDIIREMSATGDSARSEVQLLEILERAVQRLHLLSVKHQPKTGKTTDTWSKIGYDDFRKWSETWNPSGSMGSSKHFQTQSQLPSSELYHFNTHQLESTGGHIAVATVTSVEEPSRDSTRNYLMQESQPTVTGSGFFELENMFDESTDVYAHSERQLLESFLAITDSDFTFSSEPSNANQSGMFPTTATTYGSASKYLGSQSDPRRNIFPNIP